MKIVKEYYPRWVEILRAATVPSNHQQAIDELISVLGNPLYQLLHWEKRSDVPVLRNGKSYEWPSRWLPSQNRMRHYAPAWFLAYTPSSFGFVFNWSAEQLDLYGDVKSIESTHSVPSAKVSHIIELEFSRTLESINDSTLEEPTNAYYHLENRQHWNLALSVSCPANEKDKLGYTALKMLLSSKNTFVVPWSIPPVYDAETCTWNEPAIISNPSPFLVLGVDVDSDNDCLFGLSYWWEKAGIKVYGGVQHRLRQKMRLINRQKIKRIAVIDVTRFEQDIGVQSTLSPAILWDIQHSEGSRRETLP